jgi:hypothetical protein
METLALSLSPAPVSGAPLVWIGGGQAGTGRPQEGKEPLKAGDLVELKATDRRVRAHETAHQIAGGGLVRGGAQFTYRRGSDGQLYAVGGEVTLDTSPVPNNPRATQAKMQQVVAAALAPADPSAQDRAVAARAAAEAVIAAAKLGPRTPAQALDLRV